MNGESWAALTAIVVIICITAGAIAYWVTTDDYTRCTWRQDDQVCARLYLEGR